MLTKLINVNLKFIAFVIFIVLFAAFAGCDDNSNITQSYLTLEEELQVTLDDEQRSNFIMGVSAAVIAPGQDIWLGASGMSDTKEWTSVKTDMLFGIGSITKTFTAALTLKLAEEGQLTLDDSLHKWLPSFQYIDSTITIRQLLNHTSGIYNFTEYPSIFEMAFNNPAEIFAPEDILTTFLDSSYFAPGSNWTYSNTNYILLGMIIKKTTNSKISTEFRNHFLNPLNLNNTFLDVEEMISGDLAHNWSYPNGSGKVEDISSIPRTTIYSAAWTAGGMISTAKDIALWGEALYGGKVLSQSSLDQMVVFYPISSAPFTGYGLGTYRAKIFGREIWGHGGSIPGFTSVVIYSPEDRISIAVLINQDTDDRVFSIAWALFNAVINFNTR